MEISEDFTQDYRDATRRVDRTSCPSAEELTALAENRLAGARRDELLDHVLACSECALELRLAREARAFFVEEAERTEPADVRPAAAAVAEVARPTRSPSRLRARWLALAATVLLAVAAGVVIQLPVSDDAVRSVVAGATDPATGARLDAAPDQFEWPPVPAADRYRVKLLDAGGEVLWQSTWGQTPSTPLPGDVVAQLVDGKYLWLVEVGGPVTEEELGPFFFSIGSD